eukprot:7220801-Ditylum_brightwellii.AAC.2
MARGVSTCIHVRVRGGQKYASSVGGWLLGAPAAEKATADGTGNIGVILCHWGLLGSIGSILTMDKPMVSITTLSVFGGEDESWLHATDAKI